MLETPRQLVSRFERGELDRTEFQSLMSVHARELIEEIEEEHQNPFAAWLEARRCKAVVKNLLKKHNPSQIREILVALSDTPGFPLAKYLWNACHPDVPLHCFFRVGREPVFQILSINTIANDFEVSLEMMETKNRRKILLTRNENWQLEAPPFDA